LHLLLELLREAGGVASLLLLFRIAESNQSGALKDDSAMDGLFLSAA
jgi:hypothetical protein